MTIDLSPHAQARIRELVERGQYPDASTAVESALDALAERRAADLDRVRALVLEGFSSGDGGEFTPELWAEIAREADEADRLGLPIRHEVQP